MLGNKAKSCIAALSVSVTYVLASLFGVNKIILLGLSNEVEQDDTHSYILPHYLP